MRLPISEKQVRHEIANYEPESAVSGIHDAATTSESQQTHQREQDATLTMDQRSQSPEILAVMQYKEIHLATGSIKKTIRKTAIFSISS